LASENIKGRSVDEALREIKEKIQDLVEELKSILGI
jgi:predicted RNase H-like HicB family nuclease